MLDRMDQIMRPETTGLKKKVSAYFHENIWYTPSGILSKDQFEYMVKVFNGRAQGSAEYLSGTSLEALARYARTDFDPFDAEEAGDLF